MFLFGLGLLLMAIGVALIYAGFRNIGVLRGEEVVDRWGVLIENGRGYAEEIFNDTKRFIEESEAPGMGIERKEIASTIVKEILGVRRSFLVVTPKGNPRLKKYQTFICARDYGKNLDVSWYLTCRMGFFDLIRSIFSREYVPRLDLFDEQDLRAYVTNAHHSLLKAVEKLMLNLDQDPSKVDRRSRGFLSVS